MLNFVEAVSQIKSVASHINEHIRQQDNFMRMLVIQKSLSCSVGPRILIPGRIFIKEGPLRKARQQNIFSNTRTSLLGLQWIETLDECLFAIHSH